MQELYNVYSSCSEGAGNSNKISNSGWESKPAKKDIFDKTIDYVGEKVFGIEPQEKTQIEQFASAYYYGMQVDQQQFLNEYVNALFSNMKNAASYDAMIESESLPMNLNPTLKNNGTSSTQGMPKAGIYIPKDANGNPIPLSKQRINGQDIPLPDPAANGNPHTVLGGKVSSSSGETWPKANGKDVPWSEVHWSNHGRGDHGNPHQHIFTFDGKGWFRGDPTDFNK